MHDAIDDDSICSVDLKQNTIITDSKPVFRRVVCELLHISLQIVLKLLQRIRDPGRLSFFDSPKVLDSFRLEVDRVLHTSNLTHIAIELESEWVTNGGNDQLRKALDSSV